MVIQFFFNFVIETVDIMIRDSEKKGHDLAKVWYSILIFKGTDVHATTNIRIDVILIFI